MSVSTKPIFIASICLMLGGCGTFNQPSLDELSFWRQVKKWVPIGTSVVDATKILEAKEFYVHRDVVAGATTQLTGLRSGYTFPAFLLGSNTEWYVCLSIENEHVVGVSAKIEHRGG